MPNVARGGWCAVIPALGLAITEIFEPRLRGALIRGFVIAAGVLLLLVLAFALLLHQVNPLTAWGLGAAFEVLGDLAILALAWLLFPVVATIVLGFFLDGALDAVERQRYPRLPPPRRSSLGAQLRGGLRLAALGIALNLLALPLYLFLPGINLVLFYGINGWLLGREYFELVAQRRLDEPQSRRFWRAQRPRLLLAGIVIAVLMTLPLVNLVAPFIGALFMLHLFERLRQGAGEFLLTS
jgi:uncharacterized protein involved in cysteine biosynthesis